MCRVLVQTDISPLDAAINKRGLKRAGDHFKVCSFGDLTLNHFVQTHHGQLNVAITYGFAAHDNRLMVDATGAPMMLSLQQHFSVSVHIPRQTGHRFRRKPATHSD